MLVLFFVPQCQCQSCLLRVLKTIAGVESAASMWGDSQAGIQTYVTFSMLGLIEICFERDLSQISRAFQKVYIVNI